MESRWDRGLAELVLHNVRISAKSLNEAWKTASTEYLVRSVLVASDSAVESLPFAYEAETCTVENLYDAIASAYGLRWVQDNPTGIVWFHPINLGYDHILATEIHVAWDQLGLPMQTGILEPLADSGYVGMTVKQWGDMFQNTFNYAVDVPAGVYTVRDLLNLCCVANPTKTFFAQLSNDSVFVIAVNLVADGTPSVPVGALHLWDVKIAQARGNGVPPQSQLMKVLADPNPEVRHAARSYLEAIIWSAPVEEWMRSDTAAATALWTCIGVTSVLVRSENSTHHASVETMRRLTTDDFLLSEGEPGLAVMVALDLGRLTKDASALQVVARRNFGVGDLEGVTSDACRVVALSGYLRKALQAKSAEALIRALKPLAAMIQSPAPAKLDFKVPAAP